MGSGGRVVLLLGVPAVSGPVDGLQRVVGGEVLFPWW